MRLQRLIWRATWCATLCALVGPFAGCAGPRLGSRLFPQLAEEIDAEPEFVAERPPLPSQQASRPASVAVPPTGQYDAETASAVRTHRSSGFVPSVRKPVCFS